MEEGFGCRAGDITPEAVGTSAGELTRVRRFPSVTHTTNRLCPASTWP